jgi:glucosamine--fructose-6-phosphate aminotransferase (isomerizing)
MAAEMAQQPEVLAALAGRRGELAEQARAARPDPLVGTVLVARGSSDHAAIFGRYLLEPATGRPVGLAAPSLETLYDQDVDYSGYLVIATSQSGRTPEIATVADRMRARGARTLAITNEPDSPLARSAHGVVGLGAGAEQAVPATKTFTATAAAFALTAEALGRVPFDDGAWERLPGAVEEVLADMAPAERAAETLAGATGMLTIGRGYAFAMALEAALKLKETTQVLAEGYSSADLRHGPKVVVSAGFPVLALSVSGPAAADVADLVAELRGRGAQVLEIADRPQAELPIPAGLPESLAAIVAVVRAQQLSLALARTRGLDPDAPVGLSKVTPTE